MSKKQTRRSVSVCKETYEALQQRALDDNTSCSGIVEMLVRPYLGLDKDPPVMKHGPVPKKQPEPEVVEAAPVSEPPKVEKPAPVLPPLKKGMAREVKTTKKEPDPILGDMAHKIFTF